MYVFFFVFFTFRVNKIIFQTNIAFLSVKNYIIGSYKVRTADIYNRPRYIINRIRVLRTCVKKVTIFKKKTCPIGRIFTRIRPILLFYLFFDNGYIAIIILPR